MVAHARSRRGGSTLGCLFSLVLFVAALYYGVHIGQVYLRYYQLLDAMRFQAQIAPTIRDDNVIDRRLMAAADSILGQVPGSTSIALPAGSPSRPNTASVSIFRSSSTSSSSVPAPKQPL